MLYETVVSNFMKNILLILFVLTILSCNSEKRYEDYNEEDFYEVQGIITSANPNNDPFDSPTVKNIYFEYFFRSLNTYERCRKKFRYVRGSKWVSTNRIGS